MSSSASYPRKRFHPPRWRIEVLSPVDLTVIWRCDGMNKHNITNKWLADTGNTYLNISKINRIALGDYGKNFIRFYKIGSFARKTLTEEDRKKYELINIDDGNYSESGSCLDDYSTCDESTTTGTDTDDSSTDVEN
jgi:hypothetical protein